MVLFVEDHQLIKSEFYEYLNSLISGGEIPGLFTPQELEPLLQAIQDEMKNQYEYRTSFDFFVSRVKKNLHIILSLDSMHQNFELNLSQNPALTTKSIIWMNSWTRNSMQNISNVKL